MRSVELLTRNPSSHSSDSLDAPAFPNHPGSSDGSPGTDYRSVFGSTWPQERAWSKARSTSTCLWPGLFLVERPVFSDLVAADIIQFTGRVCEGRGLFFGRQAFSGAALVPSLAGDAGLDSSGSGPAVLSAAGWSPNLPRANLRSAHSESPAGHRGRTGR